MRRLESAEPVEPISVADRVADELRAAILGNRLAPGVGFSLRQTATALGVSFIPVREALRTLSAEGLLITRRGRSATVTPLSHDELDSVFRLRRLIEPELAALAAPLHRPEDLDHLETLLSACSNPSAGPDRHATAHIDFHLGLLRPAATRMDERLLTWLARVTSRYARLTMEPLGSPPEQHLDLGPAPGAELRAFRTHDACAAHEALVGTLDQLEAICRRAMTSDGPSSAPAPPGQLDDRPGA